MKLEKTHIAGVVLIVPRIFTDQRGTFSETYSKRAFFEAGIEIDFVQDNRSHSIPVNTIRGLHFQSPPCAQAKLVSVQRGRIFDVAVDLRRSSPTFRQHVAVELTAERGEQLFIPAGLAHGFCTLEPNATVSYKVDEFYAPNHERGLHWRTPELDIPWPCRADEGILSPKDAILPDHIDLEDCFP
jgi:dTDP-4-dehydrorhamnose 3,5-epimerase